MFCLFPRMHWDINHYEGYVIWPLVSLTYPSVVGGFIVIFSTFVATLLLFVTPTMF